MRLYSAVLMLAAVVTLTAVSTPAADAFDPAAPAGGGQPPTALIHHQTSAPDWVLIGARIAGAITIAGAGRDATPRSPGSHPTRCSGRRRLVTRAARA